MCLYLFVSVKNEMRVMERRQRREHPLEAAVQELRARLDRAEAALQAAAQQKTQEEQPPCVPKTDVHLAKRAQAIRMNRRGESPATIAAALDIPRHEVELLLKVQRLLAERTPVS